MSLGLITASEVGVVRLEAIFLTRVMRFQERSHHQRMEICQGSYEANAALCLWGRSW